MPDRDDDILLGTPIETSREMKDSDGDGVSDIEERLHGSNPNDPSDQVRPGPIGAPSSGDPRGGPEGGPSFEKDVSIDPAANMPAGHSLDTALSGATNLDGSTLSAGPNHDLGGGHDDLLTGHSGGPNPLDVQRDPTDMGVAGSTKPVDTRGTMTEAGATAADGTIVQTTAGNIAFGAPPDGAELSSRAPNWGLVSGDSADGGTKDDSFDWSHPVDSTVKAVNSAFGNDTKADAGTKSKVEGTTPIVIKRDTTYTPKPYDVNPDADAGTVVMPTQEQLDHALTVHGDTTMPVQGVDAGPQIDVDKPPPDRLSPVTDPIDHSDATAIGTAAPTGAPDAAVIHTINPDSGFAPPAPGGDTGGQGGGGQGQGDRMSSSSAATAAANPDAPDATPDATPDASVDVTGIGSAGGGIHTVAAPDVADAPDVPVDDAPDAPDVPDGADASISPVDSFAQGYLEDASSDALAPDLSGDLSQPDAALPDHVDAPIDDAPPLDTGAPLDDGFDDD